MLLKFAAPLRILLCMAGLVILPLPTIRAADETVPESSEPAEPGAAPNLAATQEVIEMRYRRFEGTLQQLSEYLRKTDPGRAELLVRAIGKSKEGRIPEQLKHLTDLLKKDQLGDAVERQELVVAELQSLLELLMSEARKDDLDREKKRLQELIKDVNKLIGKETDARAETERGGNNSDLQNQQRQVSDSTDKLLKKIESQDAEKKSGKNEDGSNSADQANKPNDKKSRPGEQKPGDKKDGSSKDKESKPEDGQDPDSKDGQNSDNKEGDDSKSKGEEGDSQSPDGKSAKGDDKQEPGKKNADNKKNSDKKKSDKKSDADKSDKQDERKSDKNDSKSGDSQKSQSDKPQDGKPQNGKPQKGQPKSGKPQEGEQPQDGQQQDQPQDGQEQDQQDQSQQDEGNRQKKADKTAGREEIERAKQEMDRAIEELKRNNRKNASDKQDKAIAELMKAKEKLEEILRQLREEEKELVLAQMESRFRDMLLKQEAVYNGTLTVHAVPADKRTDRHRNRSVELARNEEEISLLAAKALTLLKEEGSSIAFPEAVEQIRDDMLTIARRLERADVGEITQNIEQDTIESLKEIIEALQKELEKLKDKKQQPPQQQQQQQQQKEQQGLVNKLAEMKMLRSLQYRVNRRTKQLGRLVEGEQALDQDVVSQLKQLSDRQAKVQKATYDLSTGKNQ